MTVTTSTWQPPGWSGSAGVARQDVTAPIGIRMRNWGYGDCDVATRVHRPLTVTALALAAADGSDPSVLLTVDLGWWRTTADETRVRGAVLTATGVPADRVLLHLTHTHAGPSICAEDHDLPGGELVEPYLEHLAARAADAAMQALADLRPASMQWVTAHHGLAAVRDLTIDGRELLAFDPATEADDTLLVGRVTAQDGTAVATLVNYACHPTTLGWANEALSPDYPGAMRAVVEPVTGVPCLFLQGASGDLGPREQYGADTAVADRHGAGLGHAVLGALATLPPPGTGLACTSVVESGAPLGVWEPVPTRWATARGSLAALVPVEIKELAPIDELEREWADIDPRSRDERLRRARRLRRTYADMDAPVHPLWVWRFGDVIVVAHPGEAYSALQQNLRARFPQLVVVVLNLTNGPGWVYLPTRQAYSAQRYQSWQTLVRPGSLERLEAAAAAAVEELTR
ncbi:MAG: hypothetical protein KJ548_08990 [Actinobacteria bacterium]|nr:hypothetical protein [Actinomycetota bacterium]MCG2797902.1 hypothetical protein [Cellulomonas sp.]